MTTPPITVHLRFFASLREALGAEQTLSLPAPGTVGQVRDLLIARGEPYAGRLSRQKAVRTALDQVLCADTQTINTDCELAFFPPVTGG